MADVLAVLAIGLAVLANYRCLGHDVLAVLAGHIFGRPFCCVAVWLSWRFSLACGVVIQQLGTE